MKYCSLRRFLVASAICAVVSAGIISLRAAEEAPGQNNPTSKFFVVETTGESSVADGLKIETLTKKSVFSAEGTTIETKPGASASLVLSNGCALFVGPDTRFEVKKFAQGPFSAERNDLDVEPSVSQTYVKVSRGSIGLCTSKLVAGSSMVYATPQGTANIRGRRLLIVAEDMETRVYLLEGDVTVIPGTSGAGELLTPGHFATVRESTGDHPAKISLETIPADQVSKIDDRIANACISRRTVYFESTRRKGNGRDDEGPGELRPIEVVPAKLPTEYTISPSRL